MHICFLTNEYPTSQDPHGGIGSFVKFLAENLITHNIEVSILGIYKDEGVEKINGVIIYKLKKSNWKFAKFYDHNKKIQKQIIEINTVSPIDIIEGSELNFAFFPKKTTYKKVIRLHGGHHFFAIELNKKPAFWRGYQEKKSFKKADKFIAVSDYVGSQTKKYLQSDFNFKTIYNTVDTDKFKNSNPLEYKKHSLLFVGTICEKKGVRQLVQSIPMIKKQFPNVVLNIIGRDWKFQDGSSYVNFLKKNISKDVEENIKFIGPVPYDEITNYMKEAQLCVYPSHMESFGLVLIESLLMEKPVLASHIAPFEEIKSGKDIFTTISSITPQDIAEKIIQIFSNPEKAENRAAYARKDILKRFNSDSIVNQNIEFYKSIL